MHSINIADVLANEDLLGYKECTAIFTKEEVGYSVFFPTFGGCHTEGYSKGQQGDVRDVL